VELGCISLILQLRRLNIIFESAEVILAEFSLLVGLEALVKRWLLTLVVLRVDGRASRLSE